MLPDLLWIGCVFISAACLHATGGGVLEFLNFLYVLGLVVDHWDGIYVESLKLTRVMIPYLGYAEVRHPAGDTGMF